MKQSCRLVTVLCFAFVSLFYAFPAQGQQAIAIEHVTLIDGTGRPAVPGATVLIEGDRIARVARGEIALPQATQRIDGRGKYLIPGLMDVHIHLRGGMSKTPDERTGGTSRSASG